MFFVCVFWDKKKLSQKSISPTKSSIESATGSGVRQDVWKEIEGEVELVVYIARRQPSQREHPV